MTDQKSARLAPWILLFAALPAAAQAPGESTAPAPTNVLVITVDALRRDHMSGYGYGRATTPRIDALLSESVRFDNAFAPVARSLPAHVSLWTASWPHRHGVLAHGGVKNVFASSAARRSAAELLREAGLKTTSFVSTFLLGEAGGLHAGFEFADAPERATYGARENVRPSADVAERAARWLGFQRKKGFALWAHLGAPAEPNLPAPEALERFRGDGHAAKLIEARELDPKRFQLGYPTLLAVRMLFPELEGSISPTPDFPLPTVQMSTVESMLDRYDADVRSADEAVGRLLDRLRELDLEATTTVVFAAAYGQSHGDRGVLGAGEVTLENTRIAMGIRFPRALGIAPQRIDALASLIDLLPTALAPTHPSVAAGLAAQGDGRNVLADGAEREYVLSQRTRRESARNDPGPIYAWRTAQWTYVLRPELTDYLFDRANDPQELDNLLFKQREQAAKLKPLALQAFGMK